MSRKKLCLATAHWSPAGATRHDRCATTSDRLFAAGRQLCRVGETARALPESAAWSSRTAECGKLHFAFKLAYKSILTKIGLFGGYVPPFCCSTGDLRPLLRQPSYSWYRLHVQPVICSTSLSLSFPPSSVAWYQALSRRQLSGTIGGSVSCSWTLGHVVCRAPGSSR